MYLNDYYTADKYILNVCCVNYLHYSAERFVPQFQITRCFNCCEYGKPQTKPQMQAMCGKHYTKECNSATAQQHKKCINCKGPREAWRHEWPCRVIGLSRRGGILPFLHLHCLILLFSFFILFSHTDIGFPDHCKLK